MAKHEGACPVATRKFILSQAERLKVDVIRVIEDYAKEAGIPVGTLRNWVWPERMETAKRHQKEKRERAKVSPPAAGDEISKKSVEELDEMIDGTVVVEASKTMSDYDRGYADGYAAGYADGLAKGKE